MDLRTWTSISRTRANLTAIATTAILIGSLFFFDVDPLDRVAFSRRIGVFMVALHGLFHGLSIFGLRAMVVCGVENAELALSLYRHPRRISHMDLAVTWLAVYAASPHIF